MYLRVGTQLILSECTTRQGTSKAGKPWFMICPMNANGKKDFTIFAENPLEASRFSGTVKVKKITSVKTERRLADGKWLTDLSIYAEFEGVNPTAKEEAKVMDEFEALVAGAAEAEKKPAHEEDPFVSFNIDDGEFPFA